MAINARHPGFNGTSPGQKPLRPAYASGEDRNNATDGCYYFLDDPLRPAYASGEDRNT